MKYPDLAYELGLVEPERRDEKLSMARTLRFARRRWQKPRLDLCGRPVVDQEFTINNVDRDAFYHALWVLSMESLSQAGEVSFKELIDWLGQPNGYSVRRFW